MRRALLPFAALLVACGGSPPPPSAPSTGPLLAPAPSADAGAPPPPVATSEPAMSDAGPAPTAAPPPPPEPEKVDECAPVAAAYETSLRPKLKKCWLDAANKKPNERIVGQVRYVIEIDGTGKIATMKQLEKSTLPEPVLKCMTKAVKAEPLDTAKCEFKTLTVAEKFPR